MQINKDDYISINKTIENIYRDIQKMKSLTDEDLPDELKQNYKDEDYWKLIGQYEGIVKMLNVLGIKSFKRFSDDCMQVSARYVVKDT